MKKGLYKAEQLPFCPLEVEVEAPPDGKSVPGSRGSRSGKLDKSLSGLIKVTTGYRDQVLYPVGYEEL